MESWTPERIAARVQDMLVEQFGIDAEEVTPNASLTDDLGADSLDTIEAVIYAEEIFGVEIPDDAANNFKTVKDVTDYLTMRLCPVSR